MNGTKTAVTSLGIMGPGIAILVLLLNQFVLKGSIISDADVTSTIDAITSLVGLVTGVIGRWRASKVVDTIV